MAKRSIITTTWVLFALTACKEEEAKTVEFFIENTGERSAMLSRCEVTDAADLDANCKNAAEAETIVSEKTKRDEFGSDMNSLFGN